MTCAHAPESNLSSAERCVLGVLDQAWPATATVTPDLIQSEERQYAKTTFVEIIQHLSDNGMVLYEAFLAGSASEPRFLDMMITARGKAALHSLD